MHRTASQQQRDPCAGAAGTADARGGAGAARATDANPADSAAGAGRRAAALWGTINESIALWAVGVLLMNFIYAGRGGVPGDEIGVPGHDSFYHIKMAALLPQYGLLREFPWLRFCYFTDQGQEFVSHHYGFHLLLLPFVQLSHYLTGDYLAGGRWGTCATFGLTLVLFNLLLIAGGVRWRWLWLVLFLLLPTQFFFRHSLVRAISPSLCFMLAILLLLFRGRWLAAAVVTAAYTHLYLGAVMYAPLIFTALAFASVFGPRGGRESAWKPLLGAAGGLAVGVVTYPYLDGMVEFLRLQVFGTGLTPDIPVGSEWRPYEGVWWFASTFAGPLLSVWTAALVARLRFGPLLDARELTLVLLHFGFLALTFKARRFIEYWPVMGLLSAAYLAAPLLAWLDEWLRRGFDGSEPFWPRAVRGALWVYVAAACAGLTYAAVRTGALARLLGTWQLAAAAAIYLLWVYSQLLGQAAGRIGRRLGLAAGATVLAGGVLSGTALAALPRLEQVQRESRCGYDLPAVRALMDYLKAHSQPGEVVFTDDWDIFPLYFYYNSHNHYIVGLDPKFTHARRPDLWERYVAVSRGKVPADVTVRVADGQGGEREERLHVQLSDIREHFGARWVITDRDHNALASQLYRSPELAELVYPGRSYPQVRDAPFLLWRIREPGEAFERPQPEAFDQNGVLYLSFLDPRSVEQGWGEFQVDRTVAGEPIRLGSLQHVRGLGTHAPSVIQYEIPSGYEYFEATVGVDASQRSCGGSVVASVRLDGREVFVSDLLTAGGEPAQVRVELGGAQILELRADPTPDGKHCDHVDWGSARFVRPVGEHGP